MTFEGRYRVVRSLGAGGMGEVLLAEHVGLGKPVAIKVVSARLASDAPTAERFLVEARAASRVRHEHVVDISDFGRTADGRCFVVMEYLDGEDLAHTLRREGPLAWQRVVHIGRQICAAMAEAHRCGVIHRDLKPGNVFRVAKPDDPDFVVVVDFGLAKVFEGPSASVKMTRDGEPLGTPGYMAPELRRGERTVDPRVDVYSIGALMYRLLTGRVIDDGEGASALLRAEAVPPALATAIIKATRDDPDERFQDAAELGEALTYVARVGQRQQTLRSIPPLSRPPVPPPPAVGRAVRALGLFALVVAVGLFGYVTCDVLSHSEPTARPDPG
jgi:serine/threonine protein kinase